MIFKIIIITLTVGTGWTSALKVNVEGSVSLGKEVMDTIGYYVNMFKENSRRAPHLLQALNFRRSDSAPPPAPTLNDVITKANLCKDLVFCYKIPDLIDKYVVAMKEAVESAFLEQFSEANIFTHPTDLDEILKDIRKILEDADAAPDSVSPGVAWVGVIKRINSRFQKEARLFVQKFVIAGKQSPREKQEIERNITHLMVPKVAFVESSYENSIFSQLDLYKHKEFFVCTNIVNQVLIAMRKLPEEKARLFSKTFYESLYFTKFNNILAKPTLTALHSIAMDTTFANNVSLKEILESVQKTVDDRLRVLEGQLEFQATPKDPDIQLMQAVFSDLDHLMVPTPGLFNTLLENFNYWVENGGEVQSLVKQFMTDVNEVLEVQPDALMSKLSWNVRVFLELTVE